MKSKLPRPDIFTFKFYNGTDFPRQKWLLCKYSLWTVSVTVNQRIEYWQMLGIPLRKREAGQWSQALPKSRPSQSWINCRRLTGIASWHRKAMQSSVKTKHTIRANQRPLIDGLVNTNVIWHIQLLLTRFSIWHAHRLKNKLKTQDVNAAQMKRSKMSWHGVLLQASWQWPEASRSNVEAGKNNPTRLQPSCQMIEYV